MATPLARKLKPVRRLLAQSPEQFELHQLIRLLRRADPATAIEVTALVSGHPMPAVQHVSISRRDHSTAVLLDAEMLPAFCAGAQASELTALAHELFEVANPFTEWERKADTAGNLVDEALAFAGVHHDPCLSRDYLAFVSGSLRRRGAGQVAAVCSDYFDVPVRLEPKSGSRGRLRVGPLTFDQYLRMLPSHPESAGKPLLALARKLLGPAIDLEVDLILAADQVPACIPGGLGATVGVAAWPRDHRGKRKSDVEQTFSADDWENPR
jgi:predicted component of type VI protein secretion system